MASHGSTLMHELNNGRLSLSRVFQAPSVRRREMFDRRKSRFIPKTEIRQDFS